MKKDKAILLCSIIALICIANISAINALTVPDSGVCNDGCSASYTCPMPNRDYTKYMMSERCDTEETLYHHYCKYTQQVGFCCCTACEKNDCPPEEQ